MISKESLLSTVLFAFSVLIYLPCFVLHLLAPVGQIRRYLWMIAAGLCLSASGCLFRQSYIDHHEDQLLSYDQAGVESTQEEYRASVLVNGQYSARTVKAGTDLNDAQLKRVADQSDYNEYRSASGQSSAPRP